MVTLSQLHPGETFRQKIPRRVPFSGVWRRGTCRTSTVRYVLRARRFKSRVSARSCSTELMTLSIRHLKSLASELDQLHAHLSALMPYRIAAGVLGQLLSVDAVSATKACVAAP